MFHFLFLFFLITIMYPIMYSIIYPIIHQLVPSLCNLINNNNEFTVYVPDTISILLLFGFIVNSYEPELLYCFNIYILPEILLLFIGNVIVIFPLVILHTIV